MPVNVAILGSGVFAEAAYLPGLKASAKDTTLHTIWSRSQKSAEKLHSAAQQQLQTTSSIDLKFGDDGLEQVLANKEIEGVMIVLPITAQPALVIRCLEAGKHVLSEKPIGKDVKHAKALVEEYEKRFQPKGLIWRVAENWMSEPLFHFARDALKQKELGPVLYWNLKMEGYVEDGSKYQATPWRTVPDYQGGFLLDGGVHQAAGLRCILPTLPASIIANNALHRKLLQPHDTVVGLALPPASSVTAPHGPDTKLTTAINQSAPVPNGQSSPQGTILMSFACPQIAAEGKSGNGIFITCLNGSVNVNFLSTGVISVRVTGAEGSGVKSEVKEGKPSGVDVEIGAFGRAIAAKKGGKEDTEENWGDVRGGLWDVAVIEALLTSQGEKIVLEDHIKNA